MKRLVPRPVAAVSPPPREQWPGLWTLDRELRHFGMAHLPSRTTLVLLPGDGLAVISPPAVVDSSTVSAIDAIGRVATVVIPNSFHYLYARDFMARYPEASLLAVPGLRQRVPELGIHGELGGRNPDAWARALEHVVLGPVRGLAEALFFHVSSETLILTDLAFNMSAFPRRIDGPLWRASGIPRGFGPGRTSRSMLLRDHAAASSALKRALDWPIRRIVVAHGDVVEEDAVGKLRSAFADFLED